MVKPWLNKNTLMLALASFFSDFGHYMALAIFPAFLASLGTSAALLGLIEGITNSLISFIKIFSGWLSDYTGKRKIFLSFGYFFTALGLGSFIFFFNWYQLVIAWLGKGMRGPARDALLAGSTNPSAFGSVFGFYRAITMLGAIAGPLCASYFIVRYTFSFVFLTSCLLSILAFVVILFFVQDVPCKPKKTLILENIHHLPKDFFIFLFAAGVFGLGNFAPSLLIFRTMQLLTPVGGAAWAHGWAISLYAFYSIFCALCSFPLGFLSDKIGKKRMVIAGYLIFSFVAVCLVFEANNIWYLGCLFSLMGISAAITDSLESALAADFLSPDNRGTGYGLLGAVCGVGDFFSSTAVGCLWVFCSPFWGFFYGALLSIFGALILMALPKK